MTGYVAIVQADPAVESVTAFIGGRQHRPHVLFAEAQRAAEGDRATRSSPACAGRPPTSRAAPSTCSRCRTSASADGLPAPSTSTPSRATTPASCSTGPRRCSRSSGTVPRAGGRQHRPAEQGPGGLPDDRPRHRLPAGHHAPGHRQHPLRRLRPALRLHHLHRPEPVPRGHGGGHAVHADTRRLAPHLCAIHHRGSGAPQRLHALWSAGTRPFP